MLKNPPLPPRLDRLPPDNPETIAKHAICVVEKAIHERFGVEVRAGVELEYAVKSSEVIEASEACKLLDNPKSRNYLPANKRKPGAMVIQLGRDTQTEREKIPQADGTVLSKTITSTQRHILPVRGTLFPDSPFISHSYHEGLADFSCTGDEAFKNGWRTHETVISHRARHANIPMGEGRMVVLARAVESLRRTIAYPMPALRLTDNAKHHNMLQQLNAGITERVTDANLIDTHGMHFNMSPWYNGKKVQQHIYDIIDDDGMNCIVSDIFNEGAYILHGTDAAFVRASLLQQQNSDNGISVWRRGRMEIERPPASANPYYVSLLGLLAMYRMLEQAQFNKQTGQCDAPKNSPTRPLYPDTISNEIYKDPNSLKTEFARRYFDGKHLIRDMLDGMEPELGNRFEDAIKRIPPGQEKPRAAAGIVSYADIVAREQQRVEASGAMR